MCMRTLYMYCTSSGNKGCYCIQLCIQGCILDFTKSIIMIEREGEYPTPVYPSVVSLDRGHDLYNVIHTCGSHVAIYTL